MISHALVLMFAMAAAEPDAAQGATTPVPVGDDATTPALPATAAAAPVAPESAPPMAVPATAQEMTWIGFKQFAEHSRVFVRTTDVARYRVEQAASDLVVLTLENTRVPAFNNTRMLDTRYFDSVVTSVQAFVIEGPSPSVRVEIRVSGDATAREFKQGSMLALDFAR